METVASACRLSLLFGEDKVMGSRGLEQAWKDLQAKLASGYPALSMDKFHTCWFMQLLECISSLGVSCPLARYDSVIVLEGTAKVT